MIMMNKKKCFVLYDYNFNMEIISIKEGIFYAKSISYWW